MGSMSYLWNSPAGAGDGASAYTRADWANIGKILASCKGPEGVAPGFLNELAGTVTGANTVSMNSGGAIVDGKPFYHDAAENVTIPSSVGGGNTRIDRIVLRADWTAQTVRITRIAGTDAASPTVPAVTTTSGTTYDVLLYRALVTTAGTVTLTDERAMAQVGTTGIKDANVTLAKMAANSVDASKIVDGSVGTAELANLGTTYAKLAAGACKLTNRQGGNATDWNVIGIPATNYVPTSMKMQMGGYFVGPTGSEVVTFPVAFGAKPIVFVVGIDANPARVDKTTISTTGFTALGTTNQQFFWMAFGDE
jgi:hypothetical protein